MTLQEHREAMAAIDRAYEDWKAKLAQRTEETRAAIHAALSAGKVVIERMGRHETHWPTCGTFIPSAMTPDYLTAHLMARWTHWGTRIEIDGKEHSMYIA